MFIADEVICGFGRTGNMWGSETYDLCPDMVTCAKALSAAFQPISALLISEHIYEAMLAESEKLGNFAHGFTYAGHPVTTAVACEALRIYEEIDIVGRARRVGAHLQRRLGAFAEHPLVGDVRGVGMICGLELMRDKATRTPFAAELGVGRRVARHARAHGLIVRVVGDRVVLAPPLVITEEEVDALAERLGRALDDTWSELGVGR